MATDPQPRPRRPAPGARPVPPPVPPRPRPVWPAALGGFVLGAGTVLFVVWVYGRQVGFSPPGLGPGAPATMPSNAPPSGLPSNAPPSWNPPGAAPAAPAATAADVELLRGRNLLVPVQGVRPEDVKDSFSDARGGGRVHDAMDVMAPRNTPVLAVEDGKVAKLFQSRQGGNTIYQFDPAGTYCYYYAHLDRYADDLREGATVHRGQPLGFVGSTGNADSAAPHLHFAVFRLNPDRRWWQGTPVNPYLVFHPR